MTVIDISGRFEAARTAKMLSSIAPDLVWLMVRDADGRVIGESAAARTLLGTITVEETGAGSVARPALSRTVAGRTASWPWTGGRDLICCTEPCEVLKDHSIHGFIETLSRSDSDIAVARALAPTIDARAGSLVGFALREAIQRLCQLERRCEEIAQKAEAEWLSNYGGPRHPAYTALLTLLRCPSADITSDLPTIAQPALRAAARSMKLAELTENLCAASVAVAAKERLLTEGQTLALPDLSYGITMRTDILKTADVVAGLIANVTHLEERLTLLIDSVDKISRAVAVGKSDGVDR